MIRSLAAYFVKGMLIEDTLACVRECIVRFAMNSRGRFGHIQLEPGDHVFIEIKASRTNRSSITSKNSWIQSIEQDIDNLNAHSYRSFMLCFDFGGILDDFTIARLIARKHENVKFLYFTNEIRDNYLAPD